MIQVPSVSVIIPCRNEEAFIASCLDSVLDQDYPKDDMEIFVVDGASTDKTRSIVDGYVREWPFIRLLHNAKKITPCALNLGIQAAQGSIIIRMDAHAGYPKNYVSSCVAALEKSGADNVGGVMETVASGKSLVAKAIALSLSGAFGTGGSVFRRGVNRPTETDTVFGGCYRRDVFGRIGFYDERLARSQDMEFNLRLRRAGGKIMMYPDIVSYYYPKSNLKDFFVHNFYDGIWAVYPAKFIKFPFKLRHYAPLVFVGGLIGVGAAGLFFPVARWLFYLALGAYVLTDLFFSIKIAVSQRQPAYLVIMPVVFVARHIAYGFGSLVGLLKVAA